MFVFRCSRQGCDLLFPTGGEAQNHAETELHCEMCNFSIRKPMTPMNIHSICTDCQQDLNRKHENVQR